MTRWVALGARLRAVGRVLSRRRPRLVSGAALVIGAVATATSATAAAGPVHDTSSLAARIAAARENLHRNTTDTNAVDVTGVNPTPNVIGQWFNWPNWGNWNNWNNWLNWLN